jgi:hypothetical protein
VFDSTAQSISRTPLWFQSPTLRGVQIRIWVGWSACFWAKKDTYEMVSFTHGFPVPGS